jgi:peptide methionine sulfoxide reductase msrA/msrB
MRKIHVESDQPITRTLTVRHGSVLAAVALGCSVALATAILNGKQVFAGEKNDHARDESMTQNQPGSPGGHDCSKPVYRKPSQEDLKRQLSDRQYHVTQEAGTEPPFDNLYWDNKEPGLYVDVVTGEPLFSSLDKFDSGTGWPSFTKPLAATSVTTRTDYKLLVPRVEVLAGGSGSHLGHVFDDGPKPTGMRYCINSAALRFVPLSRLAIEGYGAYVPLFEAAKAPSARAVAVLAGGCFWGMEEILRKIPGVIDTEVGYTGGTSAEPRYGDVKTGTTGHAEAVRVTFDESKLSYEDLLGYFFRMHDPTTKNRQGNDIGTQYRSAIFVYSDAQRETARRVIERVNASGKWRSPVATQVETAGQFFPAEDYHQDYLVKHPGGYTCHFLRD